MPDSIRPGDVLADRYLLVDLLSESDGGRFFRAEDRVLDRHVALHVIADGDDRAAGLMEAARVSATIADRRILRVLDADRRDGLSYVVNEYGEGTSLDHLVAAEGPLPPRRAAWLAAEVADTLRTAHEARVAHGRLVPENVLLDESGQVRIIGFCVDAALSGLSGGISEDVANLGGLLFFLLTGRWAGPGDSACPQAPTDHGRVLRARQVRAGIPRALDALCDQILNPYAASPIDTGHNPHTAQGIRDLLLEFVGDPGAWAQPAGPGALAIPLRRPAAAPADPEPDPEPEPEPEAPQPEAPAHPEPGPDVDRATDPDGGTAAAPDTPADPDLAAGPLPPPAVGGAEPTQIVSPADQATQLGMPIFDDEGDDVTWLTARSQPPAPPPPLEEPPERPLFAAQSSRTPRPGSTAASRSEYWPWEGTGAATTGSGVIPVTEDDDGDSRLPGRSWLQLAALVLAGLVLLVAVVIAYNLGRGKTPLGADPAAPTSSTTSGAPTTHRPITGVSATDLDPQADPPEENPADAPLAVDGDPSTGWATSTYTDQLGPPPGLKTGVGLVLDLHGSHDVSGIDLTLVGQPTTVKIFAADQEPTRVAGLTAVDSFTVTGTKVRRTFDQVTPARYLVVWLTALPAVDGGYRGEVAEAVPTE